MSCPMRDIPRGRIQRLERHMLPSALPASASAAAAAGRPFGLEDMFKMQGVGGAQLSADGTWVAFSVTSTDRVADSSETAIWMASATDASVLPIRMTAKGTSAGSPRWSPDGSLLTFLSSRAEPGSATAASSQVWALRLLGGEAFKLTAVTNGVDSYSWSPDAARPRLLLSVRDHLTPAAPKPATAADDAACPVKAEPWVMDSLEFKQDYVGYLDVTRGGVHLWVQEPAVAVEADGAPMLTQITSGKSSNESSATWSPDGQLVAFASNRTPEPDSNTSSNIWVVSADNTDKGATLAQVTSSEGAGDSSPAWSPDGKWIAYVTTPNADAQGTAGSGYGTPHLALAPATGSGAHSLTLLTETLDRNVSGPFWVGTDRILFYVIDSGRDELASIRPDGTELTRLLQGEFSVGSVHMPRGDDVGAGVAVVSYPVAPSEVYTYEIGGGGSVLGRKLTTVNDSWLSELSLGSVEKVAFPCKDTREYTHVGHRAIKKDQVNDHVEMFVHKPPGFIASKGFKYPTVLWIHGGPVSQYDWGFSAEQHLLAAAGFVVLSPNPRGSTGRGREFCEALFADWGGPALTDVLTGVDFAVAQGWSDPAKLCVGGWSYGGMLTNHVIVSDHRFKAAMTGASAALYRASYGHDWPRYVPAALGAGARSAVGVSGDMGGDLSVQQGGKRHHADAHHVRREGLECPRAELGPALPGTEAARGADDACRVPGAAPLDGRAVSGGGCIHALPRLVPKVHRNSKAREGVGRRDKLVHYHMGIRQVYSNVWYV